jgi:deoxycytidylate deaminase/dephospho-CoA kinase
MNEANNKLVIGLTGPLGSGVTSTSHALAEHGGFQRLSISDAIKEAYREQKGIKGTLQFDEQHLHDFRKILQDIGNEGRARVPHGWVERALSGCDENRDIVIDGIRNLAELQYLRERFSPRFFLIALHASNEIRWQRCRDSYDKNQKIFERDDDRDADEEIPTGQQVTRCVQHADYVLVNQGRDGSRPAQLRHLFGTLNADIQLMREADRPNGGFRRAATEHEVHMATAYAQSHMSQCLKRHVGAIIVSKDNLPLSIGYNENPIGMQPCANEFRHCFKDEAMFQKLENMVHTHCKSCGREQTKMASPWTCENEKCKADLKAAFFPNRNMELCTAIHAEERAIRSLHGRSAEKGTLYTTTFPCFQCSRYIADAGIKRVVYVEAYPVKESEDFLKRRGINVDPFSGFKARAFNLIFRQMD